MTQLAALPQATTLHDDPEPAAALVRLTFADSARRPGQPPVDPGPLPEHPLVTAARRQLGV